MKVSDLQARVKRLEKLTLGFGRETLLWKEDCYPLPFAERNAYLDAIHKGIAGIEAARAVLVKACHRMGHLAQAEVAPHDQGA